MGYDTEFRGEFTITPALSKEKVAEYNAFFGSDIRHDDDINHNNMFSAPSLYCYWEITSDGTTIFCSDSSHFYHYDEWLELIIKKVIPENTFVNGVVSYHGEHDNDFGLIIIRNNVVEKKKGSEFY